MLRFAPYPADAPPWLTPAAHVLQGLFVGLCAVLGMLAWMLGTILWPFIIPFQVLGALGLAGLFLVALALPRLDRVWLRRTRWLLVCGLVGALPWIALAFVEVAFWYGAILLIPAVLGGCVALVEVELCSLHRRRIATAPL